MPAKKVKQSRTSATSDKKPRIIFTGGGTGGHVIPNLAIVAEVRKLSPRAEIFYVGSHDGIEAELVKKAGIPFFPVATGKLRRYFAWENFRDALRIPRGIFEAVRILRELKPSVVFAKGGFVSVPAGLAAAWLGIPLLIHESDATLGLATRILAKFANKILLSFPESSTSKSKIQNPKSKIVGNPTRALGNATRGKKFLNFKNQKPILLVVGGSTGAQFLNELISGIAPQLTKIANVVLITGRGKDSSHRRRSPGTSPSNIRIFEFLNKEYPDVLACSDLVISRAGANAIFEIAANAKPSLLVPLPVAGSRGDQLLNARYFERAGAAKILTQEKIVPKKFAELIQQILRDKKLRATMSDAARKIAPKNAAEKIARLILGTIKK